MDSSHDRPAAVFYPIFFALTNVRELGIHCLNIPRLMPKIRRYFGHFLPTVRTFSLRRPVGSSRQIIYFIGLFQHLENLELSDSWACSQNEPAEALTLTPPSAPPLRGRSTIACFTRAGFMKDMIDLFGEVLFRHMDLCGVDGMQFLLATCAKPSETLRLNPICSYGEGKFLGGVYLANDL